MNTKTTLLFFSIILLTLTAHSQGEIRWNSDSQLDWKDFKAKAQKNRGMAAETYTNTKMSMSYENGKFYWNVDCYFDPKFSWVIPEKKSEDLLKHEHLHFDIAELNARQIRRDLEALDLKSIDDSKKIQTTFQKGLDDLARMQKQYDKETNHGLLDGKQSEWNKRISKNLSDLEKYATSNYPKEK